MAIIAIWDAEEIKIKGSRNTIWKRDVTITDKSKTIGLFTLWGRAAKEFSEENLYKVLALRRATLTWIRGAPKVSTSYKPGNTLVWVSYLI